MEERTAPDQQRGSEPPADAGGAPLVSVLIRSMERPTLAEALGSVALQIYPNIEVIVVDAKGSGHQEVGDGCGRFPLRLVSAGCPLKRSPAANLGLDSAQGKYCIFLDDDDLFDPDHVTTLVEALEASSHCMAAYAGVRVEDKTGKLIGVFNESYSSARFIAGNYIPIHAILFRRDLLGLGCRFDERFESYEDWDFWLQVSRRTDFVQTSKVTAAYRVDLGDSGMSQALDSQAERQRQARLMVWEKWWPEWMPEDLDRVVSNFRGQLDHVHSHLGNAIRSEHEFRGMLAERDGQVAALGHTITERDGQIAMLHQQAEERDRHITHLNKAVSDRDTEILRLLSDIDALLRSTSWRLTAPVRHVGRTLASLRASLRTGEAAFGSAVRLCRRESLSGLLKDAIMNLRRDGLSGLGRQWKALAVSDQRVAARNSSGLEAKPGIRIAASDSLPLSSIDITKYDHFFFDVFDTAVIRLFRRPTDLFEFISFKTKDPGFHRRRVDQEAEARKAEPVRKDISIHDIYRRLAGTGMEQEIAAELQFCVANPEVHAFYSRLVAAGKKIHFVSDMYLDRQTIATILERNGYSTYEAVHVSSEDDLIKGDGSRFAWLKQTIPESAGSALHLGDNRISDFVQPRAHGFDAVHTMEADAYHRQDAFLYSKIDALDSERRLGISFLLAIFRYWKTSLGDDHPGYWRQFGFFYGGALVAAFCRFLNERVAARRLPCKRIFFLARDGDIMSRVYRVLFDDIEPVYLLASRRCMSLPSIKSLTYADDADALRLFTTPIGVAGASDVLERFGYPDLQDLEAHLAGLGADASKWTDFEIYGCLQRSKKTIIEKVEAERRVLLEYLSEMKLFDEDAIVIADVGWAGTIQNSLVKLLELSGHQDKRLYGFYLGVNSGVVHRDSKTGFLFDGDQSPFVEYLNLIELLLSSPQDGVVRVEHVDGEYVPVAGKVSDEEQRRQRVALEIQQGIIEFAELIKQREITLDFIRAEDFRALFMALQMHPSEEDVAHLGELRHAMTLGNNFGQHVLSRSLAAATEA